MGVTVSRAAAVSAGAVLLVGTLAISGATVLEPNPWRARPFLNFAHQGGEIEAPSNTLYAFKRAAALGADVLELDVHQTADGHIVVLHDATVDRTTNGEGRVDAMTLEEIKALDAAYWFIEDEGTVHDPGRPTGDFTFRGVATGDSSPPPGFTANDFTIPTLAEVLTSFPAMLVNIEIKNTVPDTEPYEDDLAALLAEHGRADDTIVVSFNDHSTELFRLFDGGVVSTAMGLAETAVFWASMRGPSPGVPSHHHAPQVPIEFEGIPVVDQEFVDDAHESGYAVHVWTINDCATMKELIGLGVDGIMTDRPSLLEDLLTGEVTC